MYAIVSQMVSFFQVYQLKICFYYLPIRIANESLGNVAKFIFWGDVTNKSE